MDFDYSPEVVQWQARLNAFIGRAVYPNEQRYCQEVAPAIAGSRRARRGAEAGGAERPGLWNLFLPESARGAGLTNLEYAPLCEIMGRVLWAPEVFNCSAPDTGNMEVLERYGTPEQKEQWLEPLLAGEIRSAFAMTEPDVASSDATNIESAIVRDGDHYVINGRKWWSSGAGDPRCTIFIFMGKSDPTSADARAAVDDPGAARHAGREDPAPAAGVRLRRRAARAHGDRLRRTCACRRPTCCSAKAAASRSRRGGSGPGRIHHCMRLIGVAERALEKMCKRVKSRVAFGKPIAEQTVTLERIAEARIMIDQARLLTLKAAYMMDTVGNKVARAEIAMIKVAAPTMALPGDRLGDPGARRRRRLRRLRPRARRTRMRDAAPRRRARRSASQPDRQAGAGEMVS